MSGERRNLFEQIVETWGPEKALKILSDTRQTIQGEDRHFPLTEEQIREIWTLVPDLFPEDWTLPLPDSEGRIRYDAGQKEELLRILRMGKFPCEPRYVEKVIRLGFRRAKPTGPDLKV